MAIIHIVIANIDNHTTVKLLKFAPEIKSSSSSIMAKLLKGKKRRSKTKALEKIMAPPPEKPFRRDWLEGLQYLKDLPSIRHDA